MKKLSYLCITCLAFAMGTLTACMDDPVDFDQTSGDGGTKQLWLDVVVPGASSNGATRAITANEENTIQTIDVIAFRIEGANETFDYWASATLAPGNTPGAVRQTFVANLRAQSYQQRFVVITNAHDQVNTTLSKNWRGASKAQVLADLKYNLASGQDRWNVASPSNYTRLPMWGESAPETVTASTTNLASTINLIRMVARIDVKLDTSVSGLTDQFKMKSVAIYNTNTVANIVPDAPKVVTEQRNGETYLRVNATTVPAENTRSRGPINYTDFTAPGVTDVSMIGAIYTLEVANSTDPQQATAIVVGGVYGTDASQSYYRVELWQQGSTTTRLDLLRNHQYVINITAVRGRGHATAEEAFTSQSVNMTANILAWNQPAMDNVVFDGQNVLATDKDRVDLFSNAYTNALATGENAVQVRTDVPAGWTVNQIANPDGSGPPSWMRVSPTSGSGNNTNTQMVISADANNTGSSRTATVTLAAGRLRLPIRVTQGTTAAISLNIVGSSSQEIQELVFASPAGVTPASQSFTVNWQPASNPVRVQAVQVGQYEFRNPGGNPAENNGAPYTNMPWPETTGSKNFVVSPSAMSSSDLNNDPFIERSSRFDMTINNGQTTITKSILLRQLQYALRVEASPTATSTTNPANALTTPYAPLGGKQYTYNVRSNSTWRITAINETRQVDGSVSLLAQPANGDNVYTNAQGLANSTPGGGTRELFTTNNTRRGNAGFIDVTYSSDPSGRFTDVTQRIYIPSAPFVVYGITGMSGSTASTYNIYSGNANSTTQWHPQTMVNYAANFGVNINGLSRYPLSTVFVAPVTVTGYNNNNSTTITSQQISDAANAGADMLVISGSTTFDQSTSDAIYNNFLAKDKPVLLLSEDPNNMRNLFLSIRNAGKLSSSGDNMSWSTTGLNGNAPVYQFIDNAGDPLINNGKFRNLSGAYWGCDGSGSIAYWFSNSSGQQDNSNVFQYSNARNQSGSTDALPGGLPSGSTMDNGNTAFRFRNVPLIFAADGGFLGTFDPGATTSSPSYIASDGLPTVKAGYGGGSTKRDSSNSLFVANVIGWAIQRRTTQ